MIFTSLALPALSLLLGMTQLFLILFRALRWIERRSPGKNLTFVFTIFELPSFDYKLHSNISDGKYWESM
jgi:hypothetical protein